MPSWASDLIKTDESIIAGIESAGKKYDDSGSSDKVKVEEESKVMTISSGFDVDYVESKKDVAKSGKKADTQKDEDEEEEEFSFRPAYSRDGLCFQVLVNWSGMTMKGLVLNFSVCTLLEPQLGNIRAGRK